MPSPPPPIGCVLLAAGLHGWLIARAGWLERGLMVAAAVALIQPGLVTDLLGAGLAGAAILLQLTARRRAVTAR
ncbi:MAG: hypothetical protein RML45_00770 [Acetobacteraceae bacterium]|nr:hypothetical protein [Acetobacteraceae bacterium]